MQHTTENRQNWALLVIYSGYRALLAMILTIMFLLTADDPIVGQHKPLVFIITASIFTAFAVLLLIYQLLSARVGNAAQVFFSLLLDIVALVLFHHSSADDANGMALLILPTVAAGNMLLSARLGTLLAAMASITVIADSFYRVFYDQQSSGEFAGAGLLGMAFFTTSLVVQHLSSRIVSAQALAEAHEADVHQLLQISERIVQNMRTGIMVLSHEGVIRLINDAAAEMLGITYRNNQMPQLAPLTLREALRQSANASKEANGDDPQPPLQAIESALRSERRQQAQFRLQESGRVLQVNRATLSADDQDTVLLFIEDVSQMAQQAQQLKLASLGQFTASIAHEIRNPLGAISHAAQLLAESETLDATDQRLLDIVQTQSARMNNIIENILQLSRRKSARPEAFDLHRWLQEYCTDYKATALDACHLAIVTEGQRFTVNVDPDQLHQLLTVLVDNGLRYSHNTSGKREIRLQLRDNGQYPAPILEVIDYGPGIADKNIERLFEPFFTTESHGTGLGLYICKELCEANQIHITWLRTDDGESCFRLSFSHPDRRHSID